MENFLQRILEYIQSVALFLRLPSVLLSTNHLFEGVIFNQTPLRVITNIQMFFLSSSPQDTCVALQALAEFAGKAYGSNADFKSNNLAGSIKIKNIFSHDFTITDSNRLVLQRVEIPAKTIPNKLNLTAKGAGCAMLQVKRV